jgi:predicted HTH domain antitoxin
MTTLEIEYPEELLDQTDQTKQALERLAREALLVRLYDLGKLSSGKGAELLGISRWEFLELLDTYGVSTFDNTQDVAAEAKLAIDASRFQHKPADEPHESAAPRSSAAAL